MKVIYLKVRAFGGIEAFEARLDGQHGLIRGPNAAGKTSALNSLIFALGGKVEDKLGAPMQRGADRCEVELGLTDYTVTRVIETGKAPKLVVRDREDKKIAKPQTFLDSLVPSGLAFRPMDFKRYDARKQRELLLAAMGSNLEELERAAAEAYEARRDLNRDLRAVESEMATLQVPEGTPDEMVDTAKLVEELRALDETRRAYDSYTARLGAAHDRAVALREEVRTLQERLKHAEAELESVKANKPEVIDEGARQAVQDHLETAAQTNRAVAAKERRDQLARRGEELRQAIKVEQERLDAVEADKQARLREAAIVPGLEVREQGIYVDGIPFNDLNQEQQLEVGIAVALEQNPQLKTVLIDGAESIDLAHWRSLIATAEQRGLQIIATEVAREGGALTFEIVEAEGADA